MMKIVILTNHSYMLYQFRRDLIKELLKKYEVVIGVPFGDHVADFVNMGCKMIDTPFDRRGTDPLQDIRLVQQYERILKEEKPDKVITYSIKPNIYGGRVCEKLGIPFYVNVQGLGTAFEKQGLASLVTWMYKNALRDARVVFFENEKDRNEFIQRGIIPIGKSKVLQGAGVDTDYYSYVPYPDEEEGIRFLYLGRIMKEKGMDEFLAAVQSLKKKYGDRVAFDVVGFFEEPEYIDMLNDLAANGVIHFFGFQEDPRPWYGHCHCVVMPSYHEGMSNVLLEGASVGRALITTDIPGCKEAVLKDKTGFLCKVKNAESLEQAMERFLALSPEERKQMGEAGREWIKERFYKQNVVSETIKEVED